MPEAIPADPVYSEHSADPEYREILELFAGGFLARRQALCDAYQNADFSELLTLAHQLKGAGGGFGFPGLTRHAALLEQACRDGQPGRIATEFDRLLAYMRRIAFTVDSTKS